MDLDQKLQLAHTKIYIGIAYENPKFITALYVFNYYIWFPYSVPLRLEIYPNSPKQVKITTKTNHLLDKVTMENGKTSKVCLVPHLLFYIFLINSDHPLESITHLGIVYYCTSVF